VPKASPNHRPGRSLASRRLRSSWLNGAPPAKSNGYRPTATHPGAVMAHQWASDRQGWLSPSRSQTWLRMGDRESSATCGSLRSSTGPWLHHTTPVHRARGLARRPPGTVPVRLRPDTHRPVVMSWCRSPSSMALPGLPARLPPLGRGDPSRRAPRRSHPVGWAWAYVSRETHARCASEEGSLGFARQMKEPAGPRRGNRFGPQGARQSSAQGGSRRPPDLLGLRSNSAAPSPSKANPSRATG